MNEVNTQKLRQLGVVNPLSRHCKLMGFEQKKLVDTYSKHKITQWRKAGIPTEYAQEIAKLMGVHESQIDHLVVGKIFNSHNVVSAAFKICGKPMAGLARMLNKTQIDNWNEYGVPTEHWDTTAGYLGVELENLLSVLQPSTKHPKPITVLFKQQGKTLAGLAKTLELPLITYWNFSGIPEEYLQVTSEYLNIPAEILNAFQGPLYKPTPTIDEIFKDKPQEELAKILGFKSIYHWRDLGIPEKHLEATAEYLNVGVDEIQACVTKGSESKGTHYSDCEHCNEQKKLCEACLSDIRGTYW